MKLSDKRNQRKTLPLVVTLVVVLAALGSMGAVTAQEVTTLEQSETEVTATPGETVELTTTFSTDGLNGPGVEVQLPPGWLGEMTDSDGGSANVEADGNVLQVVWTEGGTYEVTYEVDVPEDATAGDYTVDVEGSGIDPDTGERVVESTQTTITVEEPDQNTAPIADAGDDQTVDEGDSVTLDATGSSDPDGDTLSYSWTQTAGPDVTLSDASSATPTFTAPEVDADETLTFQVEVSDGELTATDTVDVTVQDVPEPNQDPTAAFTVDPASPEVGEDVTLDASDSTDADGEIVSYEWSVDGETLTGETATTSFDAAGDYEVTLTVTDDDGATDTATRTVSVSEAPPENQGPTAAFTVDPASPEVGEDVSFDASNSEDPDGEIVSYEWDFDDGTTDSGETATHAFDSTGDYEVTLTVTDDDGATDTATRTVSVSEAPPENQDPTAAFTVDPVVSGIGEDVSFDASNSEDSDGEIVSYEWNFGDGPTATGETATHAFDAEGEYEVTLTVTDDDGDTDTVTRTVVVLDEPEPSGPSTAVSLSPESSEVVIGETETYDVVVESADGGVGVYEVTISLDDASVASITDVTFAGEPDLTDVSYAEDGSSVTITAALMDTADTGSVSIASITVEGAAEGSSDLAVDVEALGNEDGDSYSVTDENGASISVIELGPVGDFQNPPNDLDDDGLYEDVNGDGTFNIVDVQALFANRNDATIENNPLKFDFNGDGTFDVVDVQALFVELIN